MKNFFLKTFVSLLTVRKTLFEKWSLFRSEDNPDSVNRNRIIAFMFVPIVVLFFGRVFTGVTTYIASLIYAFIRHINIVPAIKAVSPAVGFYLGFPCMIISLILIFNSPAMKDIIHCNGGLYCSFKRDTLKKDFYDKFDDKFAKFKSYYYAKLAVISVFGGMLVWIAHILLLKLLVTFGAKDVVQASQTSQNIVAFAKGGGSMAASGVKVAAHAAVPEWISAAPTLFQINSVMLLIAAMFISPVIEEIVFRGFITKTLFKSRVLITNSNEIPNNDSATPRKRNWWRTILVCVISGLWFGIAHITGFDSTVKNLFLFGFMTLFATFLSWLTSSKYNTILPAAGIHIIYNTVSVLAMLL